jgi:hypothetical protein
MQIRVAGCMASGPIMAVAFGDGDRRPSPAREARMKAMKKTLAIVPLALAMVVGLNTQAEAVDLRWSSKPYAAGFSTWSDPLDKCVTVNISGTMEYRWWRKPNTVGLKDIWVDRVRLKKPQMEMIVKGNCHANGAPRKLDAGPYPGRKSICLRADVTATAVVNHYDDSFAKSLKVCAKVFK